MNQTAQTVGSARDVQRPLESLPLAVNRVNNAVVAVQGFIDRFHGDSPEKPMETGAQVAEPMHHGACIERLFSALDRLEMRVEALNAIG